ncbi:MAG: hypothetical protein FWF84_07630, partial [Kiritimatiellaeota bacterium]|nr:hypothetical protein [Kiritimatiellota bacterium]
MKRMTGLAAACAGMAAMGAWNAVHDEATGWWPPFVPDVAVSNVVAFVEPSGATVMEFTESECAGLSGFRTDWDRPIPLAADGACAPRDYFGATGEVADWDDPEQPGALAFDAVHRSLLVRFPGAAEAIAAKLGQGFAIEKAELALAYKGTETLASKRYADPAGMSFLGTTWRDKNPFWHAVAWGVLKPWTADRDIGPTYNAYINGAGYWGRFGATVEGTDRGAAFFGPARMDETNTVGRLDVTASLTEAAFGADLGARLRRLSDCGFLVRKWEVYDAAFWQGGYEWATGTGPRAIMLSAAPTLKVYFKAAAPAQVALPPAANVAALAQSLAGGAGGVPSAVFPSDQQIMAWAAQYGKNQPSWMGNAEWAQTQQLWTLSGGNHGFPETPTEYKAWFDRLLSYAPRRWSGFDAAEMGSMPKRYATAVPDPLKEHLRLYWWAWLAPDRELWDGMVQGYIGGAQAVEYYQATKDWRGNFSVYRTYCREMGTMNFNHWASAGTLFGGDILESERALREGRHGLMDWPLKTWCWYDGSTQESIDHYYFAHSLAAQKVFADFGPTIEDRLGGQAILAKSMGELFSCFHPRLKRFTAGSGRTGIAYTLAIQDGLSYALHTLVPGGALTDIQQKTVGDGMPSMAQDFQASLAATLTLDGPWAPAWYAAAFHDKPIPYQMTATYKQWGHFGQTPVWRRSYQARHYGVATTDMAKGEQVPFLVNWRRADETVTSATQLGVMIGRPGLNRTELLDSIWHGNNNRNPNGVVGHQGGPILSIQDRNRMLLLTSPEKGLPYDRSAKPEEITSIQLTLGILTTDRPALECWVDGVPATVPFTVNDNARLIIKDGVTMIGLIPVAGRQSMPRDMTTTVTDSGVSTEMQGGGRLAETLRIDNY